MAQESLQVDFYSVQRRQQRKTLLLFVVLTVLYFLVVCVVTGSVVLTVALLTGGRFLDFPFTVSFFTANFFLALLVAAVHYNDARKNGAMFIRERLRANPPDLSDRYHQRFSHLVEEMRLAGGLPEVQASVIPSFAINSMALVEPNGSPAVLVTEGLLADCTRDELQAVVAHELAHIIRGDAFYVTLICSLSNFLEQIRLALAPSTKDSFGGYVKGEDQSVPNPLLYAAVSLSSLTVNALSSLMSRQREVLADATAVELCRDPLALARVIYKAQLKYSFLGDFQATYGPLYIVDPESERRTGTMGFMARIFSSHPPFMQRIDILTRMAGKCPAQVTEQVWKSQRQRDKGRRVQPAFEEEPHSAGGAAKKETPRAQGESWSVRDSQGQWQGPFSLGELLCLPYFSPMITVKDLSGGEASLAKEFPEVRRALGFLGQAAEPGENGNDSCPRCGGMLRERDYEGVTVRACENCGGKLVDTFAVERILARQELTFSNGLRQKARQFQERFFVNPLKAKELDLKEPAGTLFCPSCGAKMLHRPYNYQYFIPVEKCLTCHKIWFDADELEILQILIEEKRNKIEE